MKTSLSFLLLLFSSCITVAQQSPRPLLLKLLEENYIEPEEARQVSPDSVVLSLYDVFLKRRVGVYSFPKKRDHKRTCGWKYISKSNQNKRHDVIFAKHLYEYGFIEFQLYQEIIIKQKPWLKEEKERYECDEVITSILDLLQYIYEYRKEKNIPTSIAFRKHVQELVDYQFFDEFPKDVSILDSKFELLKHMPNSLAITFSDSTSREARYRKVYEMVYQLDPELVFSDLQLEQTGEVVDGIGWEKTSLSVTYKNRSYTTSQSPEEYYIPLNKALVKKGAPYRLLSFSGFTDTSAIVLLKVTPQQFHYLDSIAEFRNDTMGYYHSPFPPFNYVYRFWYYIGNPAPYEANPFTLFNEEETRRHFSSFDSVGFFSYLKLAEKQALLTSLQGTAIADKHSILRSMTPLHLFLNLRKQKIPSYVVLANLITEFTRGDFIADSVYEKLSDDGEIMRYGFIINGKRYENQVNAYYVEYKLDEGFVDLVNKALEDQGYAKQISYMSSSPPLYSYMYLTEEQLDYLYKHDLVW